ncbi:Mast/stem cell growth factor receptor Kit [Merluccius polli]|uniref:Platelet-derived growth factor receptor-like protein n=1 Tax=Merluccius polli TaxID=89951 RepID=A0AA47MVF0_MERPO|nr:Mast/stem cell growth factor receptor Kit [Merluccius polli]
MGGSSVQDYIMWAHQEVINIIMVISFMLIPKHEGKVKAASLKRRPRPTIAPSGAHLVVPLNGPLSLRCSGQRVVQWQREGGPRVRGEVRSPGASVLHVPRATPLQMGRYVCLEESTGEQASIYVYVRDPDNAFRRSMVFSILTRVGDSASIPCLATDPGLVDLKLESCQGGALAPGLQYSASLEKGVTIYSTEKAFEGCYVCTGRLGDARVRSRPYDLTVRPVPVAPPEIHLQAPKRVILTQGQSLSLACNTSNANGDIKLKWITPPGSGAVWYPQQPAQVDSASRILAETFAHVRSAVLRIDAVRAQDVGRYTCEALNEKGVSTESVWLDVYAKGFIHVHPVENSTIKVRSGESLSLVVNMVAYPKPNRFTWNFMGRALANTTDHVITTFNHSHRYSSELRLVRLKMAEGGVYTFHTTNGDATVNQSFTVFVISKPEIVSHEGPVDGQVRCVAEGFPAPQITWYYCEKPYVRCSQQVNATLEEQDVITITVFSPLFGKTEVESRVNVSTGRFHTLECVATVEGEQAYTLFSISERRVAHALFTPLLIGSVSAATVLCLVLVVLSYKYLQRRQERLHGDESFWCWPLALHLLSSNAVSCRPSGGSNSDDDVTTQMLQEDGLSLDTEDLLSFSYQVAKGMDFLASKNIMRSCWDADPCQRPPFRKVVERIEQQLSDTTKHIYLNFNSRIPGTAGAREDPTTQNAPLRYPNPGVPGTHSQPLLAHDEVFLEGMSLRAHRV